MDWGQGFGEGLPLNVVNAYGQSLRRIGFVLPIFIGVRLLSFAIIAPLSGLLISLAISVSGQSALTDQDIAHFIFSPMGFLAFLGVASVLLVGSVIGVAAMTVDLLDGHPQGIRALPHALRRVGGHLRELIEYAVRLVLRVLVIVLPFALAGLLVASRLISEFDINYYLTYHPPEFWLAVGIIGVIVLIMAVLLLRKLLDWAVSMHLVLFGGCRPSDSFAQSRERMAGKRMAFLRDLAVWLGIRVALAVVIGIVFGWLMRHVVPGLSAGTGGGFRAGLTLALIVGVLWSAANAVIAAISLGALARVLMRFYDHEGTESGPSESAGLPVSGRLILGAAVVLLAFGLIFGGVLVQRVQGDAEIEVIAHRGAAGARPENTMASITKAIEDGADWVEIDVQETADGEVVVMHDSDFMKLAGVPTKIWDATMADLAGIDIGSWFDPAYADERTPRLADVLEVIRDRANLLIELKYYGHDEDLEARTIALVEAAGMAEQVATMSLKYPAVQKMKSLRPDWSSGVLAATAIGNLAELDGDFIAVNAGMAGPRLVRAAEENGKRLYVWTVNDPLQMSSMMSMGVHGIITDEPGLAREVIEIRAGLSTPERIFLLFVERFGLSLPARSYRDASP